MNRIALIFILSISSQLLLACYCIRTSFISEDYFRTAYIFKGKVIKVDDCRVYFDIIKNYRGDLTNEDAFTDTNCDLVCPIMATFEIGQTWIMWGNNRNQYKFYTDGCTRSNMNSNSKGYEIEQIEKLSNLNAYSKFYSQDSVLIAEGRTKDQNREGKWKIYDKYGFPKEIVIYKSNKPSQTRIKFHSPLPIESGNDLEHEKIQNGYNPEYIGKVMSIELYDRNYNTISEKGYNKKGKLISQKQFKNGKPQGHHFARHYSAHYENGKQEGKYWIKHYKSEIISAEGNYKNGKPVGEFKYYNEEGELILTTFSEHLQSLQVLKRIRNER